MNYPELAEKLGQVAGKLEKQAGKLEGADIARAARRLEREAERFTDALDGYIASRKSGELLLETLLRSPAAKRHLSLDLLRKLLREATGKRLKSGDLPGAKLEFVAIVHRERRAEQAAKLLRNHFAEVARVVSGGKQKTALQEEFLKLGRLANDEFGAQVASRTFGELRRLADANSIRFTDKTSKSRLILLVRRYALRAAFNIPIAV
jgi:hypothetical protein